MWAEGNPPPPSLVFMAPSLSISSDVTVTIIKLRRFAGMGELCLGQCIEHFNWCVPIYIVNSVGWPTLGPIQTQSLLM